MMSRPNFLTTSSTENCLDQSCRRELLLSVVTKWALEAACVCVCAVRLYGSLSAHT